jgi:hypothetical protein
MKTADALAPVLARYAAAVDDHDGPVRSGGVAVFVVTVFEKSGPGAGVGVVDYAHGVAVVDWEYDEVFVTGGAEHGIVECLGVEFEGSF